MNGTPRLESDREQNMGGLASLPGLETVSEQLAGPIAVLRAEQARRQAGTAVIKPRPLKRQSRAASPWMTSAPMQVPGP